MNEWIEQLKTLRLPELKRGAHKDPSEGLCAMEMVAFIERLPHSDAPPCTSPVIAAIMRALNDRMTPRAHCLLPYLPRVVGTVAPRFERTRAYEVLQSAFDVVVGCRSFFLRHYHDDDGVRRAYPPWDYGNLLAVLEGNFRFSPTSCSALSALNAALRSIGDQSPGAACQNAIGAVMLLANDRELEWSREPIVPAVLTEQYLEDEVGPALIRDYRPVFQDWALAVLGRVLEIGPKGRGWTVPELAAERALELAIR